MDNQTALRLPRALCPYEDRFDPLKEPLIYLYISCNSFHLIQVEDTHYFSALSSCPYALKAQVEQRKREISYVKNQDEESQTEYIARCIDTSKKAFKVSRAVNLSGSIDMPAQLGGECFLWKQSYDKQMTEEREERYVFYSTSRSQRPTPLLACTSQYCKKAGFHW